MAGQTSQGFLNPDLPRGVILNSICTAVGGVLGYNLAGSATITSGNTAIAVTLPVPEPDGNFIVLAAPYTKGTNAAYITGVTSSSATGFTINCNTDPGSGGLVVSWLLVRTA